MQHSLQARLDKGPLESLQVCDFAGFHGVKEVADC